ncbi:hypothetical protein A2291_01610 [candidate division WOR-1 bacterium RIFOXYB2_FULL_42_35]|uniref:PpiC domain-containing protein n=1 Tax=candidate division WOR-1 bacterium RIFOXYC2_FULL_41_25 TaxID=1802586 RepID=A0A1F4TQ94_UNCSA|nr:MAG: hypothetical protein A2247_03410 [candidate division WOR-1 bacterium RIFOXYA2_FULL_41_14]OGC25442.1 MAG: hypothetical protein A2291_01610 [candidate division WOR-1 bacterium RIFOXYB2_FULL_42_35]OGC34848.1 MAG: hypothetical protein A2462_05545 [candidate division WOR-1 bacterium RIFOXYC2_FULL_41_25]OGC41863.1 MAG: hypothetical protein A2548_03675 [candidate division WOR-1 bacterium RIFOXYD2_FULL_41_8]
MLTFLRKKMKGVLIVVAFVFVASIFLGATMGRGTGGQKPSDALAKVNGQKLDPLRYREILNRLIGRFGQDKLTISDIPFIQSLALEQAVDFNLMLKEAKKKVRISGREVDMAIDSIITQQKLKSRADLELALKRTGLTMSQFKNMIKEEMLVQKMANKIRSNVVVGPNDLREIRASHILVSTEAGAKELLAKITAGEDFSALAKKYSQDTGSAANGGDLGYFATGSMVEPFEKAAFNTKVGEISGIVKSPFGYHLIKVGDSRLRTFKGEEQDIEQAALKQKQASAFTKWSSELRNKAKIEIVQPELKAHSLRFKGRFFEAAQEYKKALVQNPVSPYLHVFLGDTFAAIGKKDLAVTEYEAAISLQGGNPELYMLLAQFYEKDGDNKKAIKQYTRVSLLAGDNKALHERLRDKFKELKATAEYQTELKEIKRIEKKEAFEAELKGEEGESNTVAQ